MQYDLKIVNGLVFDGEGNEPQLQNVAIKDQIIVDIGECVGEAAKVIDA